MIDARTTHGIKEFAEFVSCKSASGELKNLRVKKSEII